MKKLIIIAFLFGFSNIFGQTIVTSGLNWPLGIINKNNYLYIAESASGKILKIDLNTQNPTPTTVVNGLSRPNHFSLKDNFLYFTEYEEGRISRININETNPVSVVVLKDLTMPEDLVLFGNTLFYSEFSLGKISKIDITQNNPIPVTVIDGLDTPYGLEISDNNLYFSEHYGNKISKIDITQNDAFPVTIIDELNGPISGMKIKDSYLYFYENYTNSISKIDITTSSPMVINIDSGFHAGDFEFIGNDMFVSDVQNGVIRRYLNIAETLLSLDNHLLTKPMTLFPNPSKDFIEILDLKESVDYKIYNLLGVEICNGNISSNRKIDIQNLEMGQYFINFSNGKNMMKFIKN